MKTEILDTFPLSKGAKVSLAVFSLVLALLVWTIPLWVALFSGDAVNWGMGMPRRLTVVLLIGYVLDIRAKVRVTADGKVVFRGLADFTSTTLDIAALESVAVRPGRYLGGVTLSCKGKQYYLFPQRPDELVSLLRSFNDRMEVVGES